MPGYVRDHHFVIGQRFSLLYWQIPHQSRIDLLQNGRTFQDRKVLVVIYLLTGSEFLADRRLASQIVYPNLRHDFVL